MADADPLIKNNVTVTGKLDADRTMVFLHGFGTDQSVWGQIAPAFAADFRLVLLDHVGAGRSVPEAFAQHRYLNLSGYANDVLAICAALQLRDAVLVGHSMGAMVGVLAAIQQATCFSKLVLIGASPRYQNDEGYHGGFSKEDLAEVYSAIVRNFALWVDGFAPRMVGAGHAPGITEALAAALKSIPPKKALTVACSMFQSDHRADLVKVTQPTLLIHCSDDAAVPMTVAHYLNQHIRGSVLKVIESSGHLPHLTEPEAVLAAMRDFV